MTNQPSLFDEQIITLVDMSPVVYKCQAGPPGENYVNWKWILLRLLKKIYTDRTNIFFVLDTRPDRKRSIDATYKADRAKEEAPEVWTALDPLLQWVPQSYLWAEGEEADDVLAWMALSLPDWEVNILTGDRDLWQLLDNRWIRIWDLRSSGLVSRKDCQDTFGVKARQIAMYKSWFGDSSDGIPGVPRLHRKKIAPLLIAPFKKMKESIAWLKSEESKGAMTAKAREALLAFVPRAKTNWKLVKLSKKDFKSPIKQYSLLGDFDRFMAHVDTTENAQSVGREVFHLAWQNLTACRDTLLDIAPGDEAPQIGFHK